MTMLIVVLTTSMIGCSSNKKTRYEGEFLILFDTVTKIVAFTDTKEEFGEYTQLIYDKLKILHELYDIYNDYDGINNIKTINDNAGIKPVKVEKEIIDLLIFSKELYEITDGKVNVALGSVLSVWHDYRTIGIDDPDKASLPSMEELEKAKVHTDINCIIIDEKASTVYLDDPNMSLDVGAIAKGYAVEKVSHMAYDKGYKNGLISVGGNVRAMRDKGDKLGDWNVGIQNPDSDSEKTNIYTLKLNDRSLVTSGDYQRYYTVDGKQYHHIIDPSTLMPSDYFSAVTVVCKDSGMADGLSTALFNMPIEEGKKLVDKLTDTEAVWIHQDGLVEFSENFEKLINK